MSVLLVRFNNKDGKDDIINHPGLYYYLSGPLYCNSRTGNGGRNYTREIKFISKLTNLVGLGRMFSKLRKEIDIQFFLEKPWIVPATKARKFEASSIITFPRKCENVRRKFFKKLYIFYLAKFTRKLRKIILIFYSRSSERVDKLL